MMDYTLRQHGRAALDFLSSFGPAVKDLIQQQHAALDAKGLDDATLSDDLDERAAEIEGVLKAVPAFRAANLLGEWHAEHHGRVAKDAFEEIHDDLSPEFDRLSKGATELHPNPTLKIPKYWDYPIHRTTGGWDGHRHMGFIHGCLVQRILDKNTSPPTSGVTVPDAYAVRRQVAEQAPRRDYEHIVDVGCQSGLYTLKLAEVFPDAHITACDISIAQLEQVQRNANTHGHTWTLLHADACATDLEDQSCDLFTSYILLHELPQHVIREVVQEGFRILRPGGDLLFADVAPYSELGKRAEWRTDYLARFGGEPYWRGSATIDMVQILKDAGFADIRYDGMPPSNFPWITCARKP